MNDQPQGSLALSLPQRLDKAVQLLERIADQPPSGVQTIAVSDTEVEPGLQIDFPFAGAERILIARQPTGGEFVLTETPQLVLPENNRRIGGVITNPSEAEVALVLTEATRGGKGLGGLGVIRLGEKQSWNLLLGSVLWCGNVSARTITGSGTIAVSEV